MTKGIAYLSVWVGQTREVHLDEPIDKECWWSVTGNHWTRCNIFQENNTPREVPGLLVRKPMHNLNYEI